MKFTLPMAISMLLMVYVIMLIYVFIDHKKRDVENKRFLKLLMAIDQYDPEKHGRLKDYKIVIEPEKEGDK